jgi:hypothetical protein
MKQKLLNFLLLFVISFSTLHAFTVDMLDTQHNHVVEYVQDVKHLESDESVCHIHHFFHISYIIPESITFTDKQYTFVKPLYFEKNYNFKPTNKLLKPPKA